MMLLPEASTPPGLRLYAIGDVHGRADLLTEAYRQIDADLARRPAGDWRVIHLGDYIDRGPDSAEALRLLIEYAAGGHAEFLIGNHDAFLRDFLADPEGADFDLWMYNGGVATLASCEIDWVVFGPFGGAYASERLRDAVISAMPSGTADFMVGLSAMLRYGDYVFVHAGVRPGVPLEAQSLHDLTWIREPFLNSDADHGAVVVHGHTPVEAVEVRRNRIGIDTGAVFTGNLTCLVLEGAERHLLGADGLRMLPVPQGLR